jgi:2-hydroxychromene-2-carboxylate isomerase
VAIAAFRRNFLTCDGVRGAGAIRECWAQAALDPATYDEEIEAAKGQLAAFTDRAIADGVPGVPTITIDGVHFWGDDRLDDAARAMGREP